MPTKREKDTLDFVKHYMSTHDGMAPTAAEIAQGIGIRSRGVVYRYLEALEAKGLIKLLKNRRSRNIELTHDPRKTIPLVGTIAAGKPIEAIVENEVVHVADFLLGDDRYALKVKGDSMIEEGIFDGDIVICKPRRSADNGEIVVALVDKEFATLKRLLSNQDGTITLLPANATHSPQNYECGRVDIQGVFIGLVRFSA